MYMSSKWKQRKALSGLMILIVLVSSFVAVDVVDAQKEAQFSDVKGHWAEEHISKWLSKELITGYQDESFKPDRNITRAEFMALVNRAMGLKQKVAVEFSDVSPHDWFAGEIAKAVMEGYISGYGDGSIRPQEKISRQEAAIIIYRLLKLRNIEAESSINSFNDVSSIPAWSKKEINAVVSQGYMEGYADLTFRPLKPVTRAEAVTILDRAFGELINTAGSFGPEKGDLIIDGNVTISSKDVTLQNVIIKGDLLLTAGIGDGNVEIDGVTVEGRTIIKGGGENSIVFKNTTLKDVIVDKADGRIRIIVEGRTVVECLVMESGARLEEKELEGAGFKDVEVMVLKPGEAVELDGDFESVKIKSEAALKITTDSRIGELKVEKEAEGTNIEVEKESVIEALVLNCAAVVSGDGRIEVANINAEGVSIEKMPERLELAKGVTVSVEGEEIEKSTAIYPKTTGSDRDERDVRDSVAIAGLTDVELEPDESIEITVVTTPQDAVITASSSDETIATVDVSGKSLSITADKFNTGRATITVTASRSGYNTSSESFDVMVADFGAPEGIDVPVSFEMRAESGSLIITFDSFMTRSGEEMPFTWENLNLFGLNHSQSAIYLMTPDGENYSCATIAQLVYLSEIAEEGGLVLTFSDDDLMDMASGAGIVLENGSTMFEGFDPLLHTEVYALMTGTVSDTVYGEVYNGANWSMGRVVEMPQEVTLLTDAVKAVNDLFVGGIMDGEPEGLNENVDQAAIDAAQAKVQLIQDGEVKNLLIQAVDFAEKLLTGELGDEPGMADGGGGTPPVALEIPLVELTLSEGEEGYTVFWADQLATGGQYLLIKSAVSADPSVVSVEILENESLLGVYSAGVGTTTVTAAVYNEYGGVDVSFDVSVILPVATGNISGTVHGAGQSGQYPIEGATVNVIVNGENYQASTGSDGSYVIQDVPAGSDYTVTATAPGHQAGVISGVGVSQGQTTPDINFVLAASQ